MARLMSCNFYPICIHLTILVAAVPAHLRVKIDGNIVERCIPVSRRTVAGGRRCGCIEAGDRPVKVNVICIPPDKLAEISHAIRDIGVGLAGSRTATGYQVGIPCWLAVPVSKCLVDSNREIVISSKERDSSV